METPAEGAVIALTPAPMNFNVVAPLPTYPPAVAIPTPERTLVSADPSIAGRAPVNCPEGRLVRFAPEPLNVVAVTTPTAFIPPARTLIPACAVTIPRESIFVTSSYVRVPPIDTLPLAVMSTTLTILLFARSRLSLAGISLICKAELSTTSGNLFAIFLLFFYLEGLNWDVNCT